MQHPTLGGDTFAIEHANRTRPVSELEMAKSKLFRVAVEGATVDGRTIDKKWLEECAANYNRQTYAARVNLEHYRSALPMTGDDNGTAFGSYGDILSLKTETIDLEIGGKTEKRLALYAEIEALDPLVALVKKGQKLYTSIEINPSFADSGQAYLMGLAVTDSPASLGTEMLEFSAKMGDKSPLAARKQQPGNHFSVAEETKIELAEDVADPTGVLASIKGFFDRFTPQPPAPVAITPPAQDDANFAAFQTATLGALEKMAGKMDQTIAAMNKQQSDHAAELKKLSELVNNTADPSQSTRPIALTISDVQQTDC